MSNYNKEYSDTKWYKHRLNPKVVKAVDEIKKHLGDEFTNGTWEEHLQCLQSVGLLDKDYNEIFPDPLPKIPIVNMVCTKDVLLNSVEFKAGDKIVINNYAYNLSGRILNHVIDTLNGERLPNYCSNWISILDLSKYFKVC